MHAWVELLSDATILDPTPAYCDGTANVERYFAGIRWSARDARRMLLRAPASRRTLPLCEEMTVRRQDIPQIEHQRFITAWRKAVIDCHRYRAARHRTLYQQPMCRGEAEEDYWLELELSVWPIEP